MKKPLCVAVVGALGAVGQEMTRVLEHSSLDVGTFKPLDVVSNVGKTVVFRGKTWTVQESGAGKFTDVDIALFSAGASASEVLAPLAVAEGAIVIDNSSQWRMTDGVPLVIPEVNPQALKTHKGLIANPNCSTIQMLVALKPLHDRFKIRRVVVSTYQAVSGSGTPAIEELKLQSAAFSNGQKPQVAVYPHQIAFNAIPHIDVFEENRYTKEEMKMVHETHKMLDPAIAVSPTAVRIPVFRGHSESLNIEFVKSYELEEVFAILSKAPGIEVVDDPQNARYPLALEAEGKDPVYVGRIRRDVSLENGLNLWVVSDNLRKGAALNAVQIAQKLVEMDLLSR
ncbi:MAG: aspartate-semialdehyde dehydrogenase [Sphaerochaeta sp.]|jgi:aspartate-semialdehyde dehydrogenase|nr:aspartate-semialdehyde dehydrogenase [Sphaerochaeta sp.]PKL28956.1 MAG: aspartate-semialdehyde dehydrogenase [Spirochaetae bacterium HGW-Spirochaetae-2]